MVASEPANLGNGSREGTVRSARHTPAPAGARYLARRLPICAGPAQSALPPLYTFLYERREEVAVCLIVAYIAPWLEDYRVLS
jgi:hypothetical protein